MTVHLLHFRPASKTIRLRDGRRVKVSTNDQRTIQQVEDGDRLHGTGRLISVHVQLRNVDTPRVLPMHRRGITTDLWAPVDPKVTR